MKYLCPYDIEYFSVRYGKWITVEKGYPSDGATGALDIYTEAFFIHDKLKDTMEFDDTTTCTNKQASFILYDILESEGRWFRKYTWFAATFIWGEIKDNIWPPTV